MALLSGAPRGRRAHSGVVLVQERGKKPAWSLITESRAGLRGRPRINDDFGSGLASADFDRDGHADLAIGTPGRERVSVLYGAPGGLDRRRTRQLRGGGADLPPGAGRYGFTLVAASDLDDDGFESTSSSAPPASSAGSSASGALHIVVRRRRGGLRPDRTRHHSGGRPPACPGSADRLRSAERRRRRPARSRARERPRAAGTPGTRASAVAGGTGPGSLPAAAVGRQLIRARPHVAARQRSRAGRHHPKGTPQHDGSGRWDRPCVQGGGARRGLRPRAAGLKPSPLLTSPRTAPSIPDTGTEPADEVRLPP